MPFQDLIQDEKQKVFDQIKSLLNNRERSIFELSLKGWGSKDIIYSLKISRSAYSAGKSRALKKAKEFFQNKSIQDYKVMITIEDSNSDIFHVNPFHVIYVKERIAHNLENGGVLKEKMWKILLSNGEVVMTKNEHGANEIIKAIKKTS